MENDMKRVMIFFAILLMLGNASSALAVIGPVQCKLNDYYGKNMTSYARANTFNGIKVIFKINQVIQVHNWIKVWFPNTEDIPESYDGDITKLFCDGFPKITGDLESPRFIPNGEYFKKYPKSREKDICKLYRFTNERLAVALEDCPDISKLPTWGDVAKSKVNMPGLVRDPSGLGCWMLGTVMPAMPRDPDDRKKRVFEFMYSTTIFMEPLDEEQGYPMIINTENERSWRFRTFTELDPNCTPWNPVKIQTTKYTKILSPGIPGRYKVFVATEPEPEPVESETFVLPCSDVSDVKLETTNLTDPESFLSVKFRTGEGGALDERGSTISLKFPKNVVFPKTIFSKSVKVNGKFGDWFAPTTINVDTSNKDFNIIKLQSYSDVENMSVCSVDFTSSSQILLPKDGKPITVEVSTSSEPNFVASQPTVCQLEQRQTVGAVQEYDYSSLGFLIPIQGQTLKAGTEVSIVFPDGFNLPINSTSSGFFINNSSAYGKFQTTNRTLKIKLPNTISNTLSIQIKSNSGLRNPGAGSYEISIQIDKQTFGFKFEVIAADAVIRNFTFLNFKVDDKVKFEFDSKPSSANPLQSDDWIIVSGQGEFTKAEPNKIIFNGKRASSAEIINGTIKVVLPMDIDSKTFVHVTIEAICKQPHDSNQDWITISTSKGDSATSEKFTWIW